MDTPYIFNLYAIYDSVASDMSQPFYARCDEHAMRMYAQSVKQSPYKKDLWLLRLAKVDSYKGIVFDCKSERVNVEIDFSSLPEVKADGNE